MTEKEAFQRLIELSNHYAKLLNDYDGGSRLVFKTPGEWIERMESLGGNSPPIRDEV